MEALEYVWIDEVKGRKRIRTSLRTSTRWYAVQARFAIQVEGQKRGLQNYEDRTLVFRAQGPEAAKRKLKAESALYGQPYLNPDGYMVRWAFERILDVYDLYDEEFNPEGTEVASVLKERRMKPVVRSKNSASSRFAPIDLCPNRPKVVHSKQPSRQAFQLVVTGHFPRLNAPARSVIKTA